MRKATLMGLVAAALMAISPAHAQTKLTMIPGEVSATATFTTDYVFRGISQSDGGPAIQGSFDYAYKFMDPTTFYLGIWGSNVDFDDGDEATIEIDFTGGFKGEIAGFTWQLGGIYYYYPNAEIGPLRLEYDYLEGMVKFGRDFGILSASVNANYSSDYFGETGDGLWLAGDVTVPLPMLPLSTALTGHIGRQKIDNNRRFGTPDYTEWAVGATASASGFNFALQYTDTSLNNSECYAGTGLTKTCDGRVLFSVSRTF